MLLTRFGRNSASLKTYRLSWVLSPRIQRLPRWVRPPLLLIRNIRAICHFLLDGILPRRDYGESQNDIFKHLSFGVEYVYNAGVEGDIAEFGTMSGITASMIARSISKFNKMHRSRRWEADGRFKPKTLFLFDSFEGMPAVKSEVDRTAPHVRSGIWGQGTCKDLSKEELRQVCTKFLSGEQVVILDGWFNETLPKIPTGTKFAMLHFDCGLYQSAREVLEYCFSNDIIAKGAAVFLNCWGTNCASPHCGEQKAWLEVTENLKVVYSDWGSYSWAGRKFIVHS